MKLHSLRNMDAARVHPDRAIKADHQLSVKNRNLWIDHYQNPSNTHHEMYDLVILGGGITGAGVARDAASRGMKVVLIEQNDFAFGTSSRSSKLIHGGIRYLEKLEFSLVFEALAERRLLFEIAPHLVHPLRFILPVYKNSRVGMFKMGLGMMLYDLLSLFETPELHERLDPHETMKRLPLLNSIDLKGAYAYSDAYMDDDRLVLETLRSAASYGAICLNYVKATAPIVEKGKLAGVTCLDSRAQRTFNLRARHFVSSVGPWTDVLGLGWFSDWKSRLRPSKGIHLTLPKERFGLDSAVVMASDDQKRIVFGIPRHDMFILGTTDTDYQGDPGDVRVSKEDVSYLLMLAKQYFPNARITEQDVLSCYAGVRPLVRDDSTTESETSREHLIWTDERNITFVTGGKYTTYRRMAEQTVDSILRNLPIEDRVRFKSNRTKEPLNAMITLESYRDALRPEAIQKLSLALGWDVAVVANTVERHGDEAPSILSQTSPSSHPWLAEVEYAVDHLMCLRLVDFVCRRSPLFLALKDHGRSLWRPLAHVFASKLGWSDYEIESEINELSELVNREMAWRNQIFR